MAILSEEPECSQCCSRSAWGSFIRLQLIDNDFVSLYIACKIIQVMFELIE